MARRLPALLASRSSWFDLAVFAVGLALRSCAASRMVGARPVLDVGGLLCVPLIVVVARFPMVLDSGEGGIEVGFDSSVLMFLLCTQHAYAPW